ncbi:tetratricopeptide repeat protein [Tunturiibacter empetritectus]|uniref:Tetratricopeptide (TPR) repeat protein n=2 Tax=Tunturiibacter TaxID=3154218 RepID=A0A852VFH9_9BACT|nr:tetratricopeptide repeat protein [Edaphobacter lichenicola]NYF91598.1 tetratricopeptide (TPR) repeat protein [Edaphobacter lichenicola]
MSYRLAIWLALVLVTWNPPIYSQSDSTQAAVPHDQPQSATDSEATLIALSKAHPTNAEPLAQLGLLEARQGHYPQAIVYYRKAMALKPAMPGLRLNLGLAFFKDGQYKQAIQTFTPLLRLQSQSTSEMQRLNVLVGMSHYGLGEYQAAVPYLKQVADRDGQNLSLLLTLAHSCLLSKQYQCVLDTYHRMVAQNAESAEADILVGEALDEMKDTAGATREFRAAVQVNPKEPNAHFGLGYLLWTQRQYQEASREFQAELENTPDYTQAMVYLADAEIQMNRNEDARSLLEKVVKVDPAIFMGHLDLGIVYAEANREEDALREFKAAAALKPDDVNVHMRLGRLYRSMGKAGEAKNEFDKARNQNRTAHDALITVMSSASEKYNKAPAKSPAR